MLAGELDLEGTDEGSFLAAEEAELLLVAAARSGTLVEMAVLGVFSSAKGLAAPMLVFLVVVGLVVLTAAWTAVFCGNVAAFFTAAAGLDLLAGAAFAGVLAVVFTGAFGAVLAAVLAAGFTVLDLAAGITIPHGHKQVGTHASPKAKPEHGA